LPYDSLAALRQALVAEVPHLKCIDEVPENEWKPLERGEMRQGDFASAVTEHYLANPIMRASELMGQLAAGARERKSAKLAAE